MAGEKGQGGWNGKSAPESILHVWAYVGQKLRSIREHIDQAQEEFYDGESDRLPHLVTINDALQTAIQVGKHDKPVRSYVDIEQLLKISAKSVVRPKLMLGSQELLKPFLDRLKVAIQKSDEGKTMLDDEVVMHLEMYCSNYTKLNIPDDDYFQALRAKTLKVRDHLRNFDRMSLSLRDSTKPEPEWYCSDNFSQQVGDRFNCEQVPVLRLIPDLIQKFEVIHAICSDWLRSDKVYVEQLERQIERTKLKIQEARSKCQITQNQFDQKYQSLKRRKIELEEFDESYDDVWREITQLEAKKTQLDIEIITVIKTLKNCRQLLEDLKNETTVYDAADCAAPEYDEDEYEDADLDDVDNAMHIATASYRSRLCREARNHTVRVNFLRKKKSQVDRKLTAKKCLLQDIESNESEIQMISKKLRLITKKKSKMSEEAGVLENTLQGLKQMLYFKQNPCTRARTNTYDRKLKAEGRSRACSFNRSRVDSFGRPRMESFGRTRVDSFGRHRTRTNSFGLRNGSFGTSSGSSSGSFSKRSGSISLRNGSFGQRTNSFSRIRAGSVSKTYNRKDSTGSGLYMAKKRIADVQKAFRMVKNKIGLNWKDLARSLPYEPVKEIHEIDRDIKEIEYEYRGELKEQAYQSLVRWYSHTGRRASVDSLLSTLKDINETRLAEELHQEIKGEMVDATTLKGVKEEIIPETA